MEEINNSLDIVTKNSETSELKLDDSSNLCYSENNITTVVSNNDNLGRSVKFSELKDRLDNRRWNIPIKEVISSIGDLCFIKDNLENSISHMDFINNVYELSNQDSIVESKELIEIDEEIIKNFNNMLYKKEKNKYKYESFLNKTVTIYNSSEITIDLLKNSIKFNIVDPEHYTDTISLVNMKYKDSDKATIEVIVEYTINNELNQESTQFNSNVDNITKYNHISIEYIDNIIKVFPITNDVDECIIKYCFITYENN